MAVCTRLGNSCSVVPIARLVLNPREVHSKVLKGLLRYVKGTKYYGIFYRRVSSTDVLHPYVDASWA